MVNYDYDLGDKELGETLTVNADITDTNGAVDPSTCKITIKAPSRTTVIDDVSMTKDDTGDYHYDYTIPADTGEIGEYTGKVVIETSSGRVIIKTFKVDVVRSV